MSRDPARALTQFFGGRVCLDFANTLDWRTSSEPQELIPDYSTFLLWSRLRGTLPPRSAERLEALGRTNDAAARAVMAEAHRLRAEIWSIAASLRAARAADLGAVNALIASLPAQPRVIEERGAYLYDLRGLDLREPLWPVLWSLTAVLASRDAGRLGCCQAEGCGWLFVDESPNRARLWCSSEICGNRERARRAYAKRRSAPPVREA
jgi:predicted RNA-binding Zn ribbon-like protein